MIGKLFGVGVGPGDPELLTLKAIRIIKESTVIAVPSEIKEESVAYKIVKQIIPDLDQKTIIEISMPMTKDLIILENSHKSGADKIIKYLKEGENVAFLTLGDPTVYSTYIYLHKIVGNMGYETQIISGITSFCAVAARLNNGLVEGAEELHIIPSSYGIEEALQYKGTKVLMKAGKKIKEIKSRLNDSEYSVSMVENCGMENEKIYTSVEEINENAGYYSLLIVKEK